MKCLFRPYRTPQPLEAFVQSISAPGMECPQIVWGCSFFAFLQGGGQVETIFFSHQKRLVESQTKFSRGNSESATNGPNQRPGISDHESATNFIESATVFTGSATKPANQRPSIRIRHHELATKSVDLAAAFCQISHTTCLYSD